LTLSFFKLQVAGNDYILVDLDRESNEKILHRSESLGELAQLILDRFCGVGGRGCIFIQNRPNALSGTRAVSIQVYRSDGIMDRGGRDPLLCAARWAFDSGKTSGNQVQILRERTTYSLTAVDSKSFMMEIPVIPPRKLTLIVDGHPTTAFLVDLEQRYSIGIAEAGGPTTKRVAQALRAMEKKAAPVVIRTQKPDTIRFIATEKIDRTESAAAAMWASIADGRLKNEALVEWRGQGGAVSFADFAQKRDPALSSGPGTLIDRGRFYVETAKADTLRLTGMAEYAFEGTFDF
jgi:hypothetical protein